MIKQRDAIFSEQKFYIGEISKMLELSTYQLRTFIHLNKKKINIEKVKTGNATRSLYGWDTINIMKEEFKIKRDLKRKIIVVSNAKGGTGKTSFATNIAFEACSRGIKTLCIDLDAQSHFTYNLGFRADAKTKTFKDCLSPYGEVNKNGLSVAIQELNPLLHLVPSTINLNDVDHLLRARMRNSEMALKEAIKPIIDDYELIIMDTSPYVGLALLNALCAADSVVVPAITDFNSHLGINYFKKVLKRIFPNKKECPEIVIVPNRYNKHKNICKEAFETMKDKHKGEVYPEPIRESTDVENALKDKKSLKQYKKSSRAFDDFRDLATYLFIDNNGGEFGVQ